MPSLIKNVIIIGAGGRLGPSILSAFDADEHFTVSVLSRKSSTSKFPSHITVHHIGDDYPEAELLEAFKGQDAVISTMATASVKQQEVIIDAAIKAGVKRFVPSEFGSDTNENAVAVIPQYFHDKVEAVKYLRSKEKEGLTWTSFVTGPMFDMGIETGFLGFDKNEHKALILNKGDIPWNTTTLASIGLAVKNAMLIPEKTANKYLYINSFTITANQLLASLEKVTNTKWEVTHVNAEDRKEEGMERMSKGDFSAAMMLIQYILYVEGHGGNYLEYQESANDLLSLPKQNLDDVLAEILKT